MAKSTATGRGAPGFTKACSMIVFRTSLEWLADGSRWFVDPHLVVGRVV
jgi:hypothetical protein